MANEWLFVRPARAKKKKRAARRPRKVLLYVALRPVDALSSTAQFRSVFRVVGGDLASPRYRR